MSKSFRYVDSFDFPASFGFRESSQGADFPRDQPLTQERQGQEYGDGGNLNKGVDVQALARGGRLAKPRGAKAPTARPPKAMAPKPRRQAAPPPAPGPSPAPGMSPLAQAMGSPGLPSGAPDMPAAPGGALSQQMAKGGTIRQRFDGGGGAERDDGPTPRRLGPVSASYADENDRKGTPGRFYAGEAERGRMGDRKGPPPPMALRKPAAARPLPVPPPYVAPPRRGTVSVEVRPRPAPPRGDTGAYGDARYDFGAGMPSVDRAKGGHLSMADRKALPKKDFALPGKGAGPEGKGSGSYPIPDASHARNALARVSQHGSPEQKSEVRAAVGRKFPGIGKADGGHFEDKSRMRHVGPRQSFFNGGHAKMHEQFGFTGSMDRVKKADGGFMKRDDAPLGGYPEEKTTMPRQMQANIPAMAKGGRARFDEGGKAGEQPVASRRRQTIARDARTGKETVVDDTGDMPADVRPISTAEFNDDNGWRDYRGLPLSRYEPHSGIYMDPRTKAASEAGDIKFAKGGAAKHPDEAQDRALIKRMMAEHERAEGEKKMARGGRARLPAGMKATALQRHSPINTPPRNPQRTTTPRNIAPGGEMAYGVQPSTQPAKAGTKQGIPQLARGGRVKPGCY